MAMELMIIYFQLLITNTSLEVILINQYIKRDGNGVVYTIGGQKDVNEMQQTLMGWRKNASLSWLTSQNLSSFCKNVFYIKSLWWISIEELKALILASVIFSGSLRSGCWWQKTLEQTGWSIWATILYIFSVGDQFVSTSSCLETVLKISALISS